MAFRARLSRVRAKLLNIKAALAQAYRARQIVVNPVSAFWFFLNINIFRSPAQAIRVAKFHLGERLFWTRLTDWGAVEEVALENEYGFIEILLDQESSAAGNSAPVVVDLGANIGMFSLYVFSLCSSAIVYSFEPSHCTYEILKRNQMTNPGLNWHIYHYAVWKQDGVVDFDNRKYSTSSRIATENEGNVVVPSLSLATLLSKYIGTNVDLMKIDVEGAEEAILCGNERLLANVAHLVVEVHPDLCNQDRVVASLRTVYPFVYRIPGRRSVKPLLLASRLHYALPVYELAKSS